MEPESTRAGKKPGPKPDTLRIEGDPEVTIRRILNVRKPEGGWPKPNGQNGEQSKNARRTTKPPA